MNKINVVPLNQNLLRCVAADLVSRFHSPDDPLSLARVTVIVPHRRGIVYLRHYLAQLVNADRPRPLLLPRLVTIEQFVAELGVAAEEHPGRALDSTDQAWLLFRLVKDLGVYSEVAGSWDRFFGWGVRLAGLIDEIDREMIDPTDIGYPEDVPPQARALLERLRSICEGFGRTLATGGFTTQAKRSRLAAEAVVAAAAAAAAAAATPDAAPKSPSAIPQGPTYLVGFYATSRSEDRIFRHLFDRGASVFWHADRENLPSLYRRWLEAWKVETVTVGGGAGAGSQAGTEAGSGAGSGGETAPRLHFHEAYDLHAEMRVAQDILGSTAPAEATRAATLPDQCALVLPDPSALVPTLYHIPESVQVNISIGYPLARSSIAALFEQIMVLEEGKESGKDKGSAYYHQDYLTLLRHPYVRRLPTPEGKDGRIVLHLLEAKARQYGRPFVTQTAARDLLALCYSEERDQRLLANEGIGLEEAVAHVDEIHARLLKPWQKVKTPRGLAATLRKTVSFLFAPFLEHPQFGAEQTLDNEFVHALQEQIIPSLEESLFADQMMSRGLLFTLLRDLVAMTRVPFEGEPLKGLQILGLLETRLLSFDQVIVLDVNEGIVPSHEDVNPLLPEPLRPAVGLPSKEKEEAITRYHFERLVGSARDVHLVWQASTTPSASGLEGKKTRSRFVEALLWDHEAAAGRLLDEMIKREVLTIPPQALVKGEGLAKTEADADRVAEFIRAGAAGHGISATLLNTYLRCPARFLYQYLLDLALPESPLEEVDSAELGTIVHKALEAYFKPHEGKTFVKVRDRDPEKLVSLFTDLYGESPMHRSLGPEKRIFLEGAVAHRLRTYLDALPDETFIESLERRYAATVATGLGPLTFGGKVDRIDRREGKRIILDYKTGSVATFNVGHFEKVLAELTLPAEFDYQGLVEVREAIADLQLPLYVMLVAAAGEGEAAPGQAANSAKPKSGSKSNAVPNGLDATNILSAYVELRAPGGDNSKERYFVRPDKVDELGDAYAAWFAGAFPRILAYLIDHMVKAQCFYRATDEGECAYCDYDAICGLAFS
jgi:ATP-dependent helicase/nuclease subunit B